MPLSEQEQVAAAESWLEAAQGLLNYPGVAERLGEMGDLLAGALNDVHIVPIMLEGPTTLAADDFASGSLLMVPLTKHHASDAGLRLVNFETHQWVSGYPIGGLLTREVSAVYLPSTGPGIMYAVDVDAQDPLDDTGLSTLHELGHHVDIKAVQEAGLPFRLSEVFRVRCESLAHGINFITSDVVHDGALSQAAQAVIDGADGNPVMLEHDEWYLAQLKDCAEHMPDNSADHLVTSVVAHVIDEVSGYPWQGINSPADAALPSLHQTMLYILNGVAHGSLWYGAWQMTIDGVPEPAWPHI